MVNFLVDCSGILNLIDGVECFTPRVKASRFPRLYNSLHTRTLTLEWQRGARQLPSLSLFRFRECVVNWANYLTFLYHTNGE